MDGLDQKLNKFYVSGLPAMKKNYQEEQKAHEVFLLP